MIHTSTMSTGPTGAFGAAALEVLKKVPLVIVEKWQGVDAVDAGGKRVFLWEEDAWIAAAKSIKAVNPSAVVIGCLPSSDRSMIESRVWPSRTRRASLT